MGPVLHGRDVPFRQLAAALGGALEGRGQLVVVSGEAGIGKSAIVAAIAEQAKDAGAATTWGSAWEFADAPPYFPVSPCLRALGVTHEGQSAFQLWETVVATLARSSREQAIVWIVEDLHASDLGTLDLLTFLAQPLRAMRALVVVTTRDRDPRLTDRMRQRITRMERDGAGIRLEPLGASDVATVASETLGRPVAPAILERLVELTGGNPLFVVECARALRSPAGMESTLGALPDTVRQVVVDRVELLPEATRAALQCGAVLGRELTATTVARMQECLPARVIDVLLPALKSGLVVETSPGRFVFSHVLVRDAIESTIDGAELARLHERADAALAPLADTADVLLERARHALAALPRGSGSLEHTLGLVRRADELLQREGAFDRAFELQQRVAEARSSGFLPVPAASELLREAETARAAGRSDVMRAICEEVVTSARTAGDSSLFANAVLLHASDVRPGVIDRRQVALLEEARALVADRSAGLASRLLARHATALQPHPDLGVPNGMARAAIAQARATDDEAALLDALEQATWGLYNAPLAERITMAMELRDRAIPRRDRAKALGAQVALAFYHFEASDFEAFHRAVQSVLALSDELGTPRHRWRPLLLASMEAALLGRVNESDRLVLELAELAALIDDQAFPLSFALHDFMRLRLLRRDEEARAAWGKVEHVMRHIRDAHLHITLLRCAAAARRRDVKETRAALDSLGKRVEPLLADLTLTALLAEAYAIGGTLEERRSIRPILAAFSARELPGDPFVFMDDGTVVRVLGLLDASLGDRARAREQLAEAHALAVERGHLPWIAQIAFELAKVLEEQGRTDEAKPLLAESARIARDLGMVGLLQNGSETPSEIAAGPVVTFAKGVAGWTVRRGSQMALVKDSRGVQLLARLVEQPDLEIHVLTLSSDEGGAVVESNAGEHLDERARAEYRRRITELDEDLREAEDHSDAGRIEKLRREREALLSELSRAVGLGGRSRVASSATERARVNVQRRLKDAISRIAEVDEGLGRYLEKAVRTGTFCSFRP